MKIIVIEKSEFVKLVKSFSNNAGEPFANTIHLSIS